ncbi:MAG: S8 family serine peptidase [Bacteroidota bacterium]
MRSFLNILSLGILLFFLSACDPINSTSDNTQDGAPPAELSPKEEKEYLQLAIEEIKQQSKGPKEVENEFSDDNGQPIKEPSMSVDPPEGAANYPKLQEADFISVSAKDERIRREQPKAKAELSPQPPVDGNWRNLGFASERFQPTTKIDPRLLAARDKITNRNFTYGFVILNEYLSKATQKQLANLNVTILGKHASAYKAKLPLEKDQLETIANLPFVEWIGYATTTQKTASNLKAILKKFDKEINEVPVVLNLFDNQEALEKLATSELKELEITLGSYDQDLQAYAAIVPINVLEQLLAKDFVLYVEFEGISGGSHDQSMGAIGADYIRIGGSGRRFSGSSVVMGIMDTGFMLGSSAETRHQDMNKNGCGRNFTTDAAGVWDDEHDHGTHVLGTITGTGTADPRYKGVATGLGRTGSTRIRAAKIWRSNNRGLNAWMRDAMDYFDDNSSCGSGKPSIVNVSGGASGTAMVGTDAESRKLDAKVWDEKQAYIVCSGNNGPTAQSIWSPGVAKNALTVGNVRGSGFQTTGDIANNSSRGATGDGRMKPNLVAVGSSITSVNAGTTNGYRDMSGCSMATPHVSGLAATILEHYPVFKNRPYLLRAHLMATSILHDDTTMPSNNTGFSSRNNYGMGRVSSYVSHWARGGRDGWNTYWGTRSISRNNWGYRDIEVPENADRLVVVMTWDEPAASSGASEAVTNDLDLWIDRGADADSDNKGQGGEWASQSSIDNVEYVIIDRPRAGKYRLKIVNWDVSEEGVRAAVVATVIKGDPTPNIKLDASLHAGNTSVGSTIKITTSVSNPSYIASGVFLERLNIPSGLTFVDVTAKSKDNITYTFNGSGLSMGNIVAKDTRSAVWTFRVNSTVPQTVNFRAWSENGGTEMATVTVNAVP